jgi:hypothetical protein
MPNYTAYNGPMVTTGAQGASATVNGTKTFIQLATPSTRQLTVISWGFSLSSPLASTIDLCAQNVADTVTAHSVSGLVSLDPNAPASLLTLGTAATGYNASAQGSPTVTRMLDSQQFGATAGNNDLNYTYQFMPDERPILAISSFLKVRGTFAATTVNVQCWVTWNE